MRYETRYCNHGNCKQDRKFMTAVNDDGTDIDGIWTCTTCGWDYREP